ncbi:MAG: hypothetical protein ACD_22C00169G0001 [uncultured bacterium]|nr:MAG: hypothetical protein ACD_22C00169G0001 [uncultured bacterium]
MFLNAEGETSFVKNFIDNAQIWYAKHKVMFWGAYAITFIAYSYFFTQIGFSNHTFPQVWTYSYPSYRTTQEGRWFQDLIISFLGGVGVTSSQMYIATALQTFNSILFAEMVGASRRFSIFLAAVFLGVYPAFCDRYIFPGSQIPFAIADTLAVLSVFVLSREKTAWKALAGSSLLLVLCLATYQPNIALVAFLLLTHCILMILRAEEGIKDFPLRGITIATGALLLGTLGYYVTVKMTIPVGATNRSHINDLAGIVQQLKGAYSAFVSYFTVESDYLPIKLRWLPLSVTLIGAFLILLASWRKGILSVISVLVMLGLIPIALRASFVINSETFAHVGRVVFPYGFALLFFLLYIGSRNSLKNVSYLISVVFIYFFTITVTQETNAAYLKMIFDTNKINRIAQRIEAVLPTLYTTKHTIVIVGKLGLENQKFKQYPNAGNGAHSNSETFANYRQTEILNFYFGRDVVVTPTVNQLDRILPTALARRPWPAPESVYVTEDVLVVLLQEYKPGVLVTWSK